jgi:hypothetical protein
MADLITRLVYDEDKSSKQKALKGLNEVETVQSNIAKQNNTIAKSATKADKALSKIDGRNLQKVGAAGQDAKRGLKEATEQAETLDARLERLDTQFTKVSTQVGQAGDIESNIRAISGAAGTIPGLQGVGAAGSGGAEIFAVIEALPRLKVAASGLPDLLQASAKGAGLGGLAGALQGAIPALGATGAALGAIALVALPLIAAVGVLSFALSKLQKRNEEVAEATRRAAEARQAAADTERDFAELTTTEQVDERNRLFQERAQLAQDISRENEKLAELRQQVDESAPLEARINGTRSALNAQKEVVDGLIAQTGNLDAALAVADEAVARLSNTELNRARYAVDLTEIEEGLLATEQERTQALNQLEASQDRVQQIEQQATQARADFAARAADIEEDRTLQDERRLEDRALAAQEHQSALAKIEADGNKRIASLRQDLASLPNERLNALAEVEEKGRDRIAKINGDFMSSQLKVSRDFAKETQRIESDTAKARLRLIQDINDKLADAEASNNIIAFLQAQKEGQQELQRQAEDSTATEKRRVEDFIVKQQEARAAQQERLQETLGAIQQEKEAVNQAFIERRAAIAEQIETEKLAIQQQQAQADANFQKQLEREALQDQRRAEDLAREDLRRLEAHQERLDQIEQQRQAQLAANFAVQQTIDNLTSRANDLNARIASASGQQNNASSSSLRSTTYSDRQRNAFQQGSSIRAFALGGIATQPTNAIIAEGRFNEAVVPLPDGRSIPVMLQGGTGNNINAPLTLSLSVGDVASMSQVKQAVTEAYTSLLYDVLEPTIINALNGNR